MAVAFVAWVAKLDSRLPFRPLERADAVPGSRASRTEAAVPTRMCAPAEPLQLQPVRLEARDTGQKKPGCGHLARTAQTSGARTQEFEGPPAVTTRDCPNSETPGDCPPLPLPPSRLQGTPGHVWGHFSGERGAPGIQRVEDGVLLDALQPGRRCTGTPCR